MGAQAGIDPGVTLPHGASLLEGLARYRPAEREAMLRGLKPTQLEDLAAWIGSVRAPQVPPTGDWRTWLILAGRGFGKTRAGAEWVRRLAMGDGGVRIALIAASLAEARAVMVEGQTGLLAVTAMDAQRPSFEPSNRRLVWPGGAQAFLYSAGEPESLRGPLVRTLVAQASEAGPVRITRGRMIDNRAHLAEGFIAMMEQNYAHSTIGRQELDGELIEEVEGALWSRALIERCRIAAAPTLVRVVIGVDPPAGAGASSDACGIVVVGLGEDGRAYVLADASVQGASPEGWARAVAAAAAVHRADRVVAEANNGGAMVESVLRAADAALPIRRVHAAHGKVARAEPVQALYAGGKVFHVGAFAELEDEMAGLMAGGAYEGPGRSPDRADALVWAMHELMLGKRGPRPGIRSL